MTRQKINHVSAAAPVALSLFAFGIVLIAVTTGWGRGLNDEGAAAHIFQLLVLLQVPIILVFLATADWGRLASVIRPFALQMMALSMAIGSVAFFNL